MMACLATTLLVRRRRSSFYARAALAFLFSLVAVAFLWDSIHNGNLLDSLKSSDPSMQGSAVLWAMAASSEVKKTDDAVPPHQYTESLQDYGKQELSGVNEMSPEAESSAHSEWDAHGALCHEVAHVGDAERCHGVAREVADAISSAPSLTADFGGLSTEELKALLTEKKKGWVNLDDYPSREALISALNDIEEEERIKREFRVEVAAAVSWHKERRAQRKAVPRHLRGRNPQNTGDGYATSQDESEATDPEHELRIVFNEANGYRNKFEELRKELLESPKKWLPDVVSLYCVGEPFPMSPNRVLLSKVLQAAFVATLGSAVLGDQLAFLPEYVLRFVRQRRGFVISTAFFLNVMSSAVVQNSAFEVYLDNAHIYSSLALGGRLPTAETLSTLILERTLLKDYREAVSDAKAH